MNRAVFVKCDVTSWEDQVSVFKVAKEKSPNGRIDVVIANAGIYGPDALDGELRFYRCREPILGPFADKTAKTAGLDAPEPTKPVTKLLDVNLIGVIYTAKLAGWYFNNQDAGDRCLILVSSIMGYIDTQGSSIYSAAKHGVRGLMTCLRRKGLVRVNCLAPWYDGELL